MRGRAIFGFISALLVAAILTGCAKVVKTAVESTVTTAARRTGEVVGETLGEKIGRLIVRRYTPQFVTLYVSYILGYAFYSGDYWIETRGYEPGEWTRWVALEEGAKGKTWIEKALLKRTEEGNEWWKVKFYDAQSGDTIVLEGLFSPNMGELLRLRIKLPGKEPSELPVAKGMVYIPPIRLSKESIEGATVGEETVVVPAGTFKTKHIRYISPATGATMEWFICDDVPGGVVKYLSRRAGAEKGEVEGLDRYNFAFELEAYGKGATSELGSF